MSEDLKIVTKGQKFDNRTKVFWGNKDIAKQVKQVILIMTKDQQTEAILVMNPNKTQINTSAKIKSETIIESIIKKVTATFDTKKEVPKDAYEQKKEELAQPNVEYIKDSKEIGNPPLFEDKKEDELI